MNPCALHNVFSEYICYLMDELSSLLVSPGICRRKLGDIGSNFRAECWSRGQCEKITPTGSRNNDLEELAGLLRII